MADIFMSYARDDRSKAELLAKAFEGRNWSVWWDTRLKAGEVWDEVIERELNAARCVVVLWSKISVDRQWVRVEAYDGLQRHILVPALIENVRPPLAFRLVQAEQLLDWSGEPSHTGLNRLFAAVSERLETQPRRVGPRLPPDLVERFVTVSTTTNSITRLFQMIINGEIDPMIRAIDATITLTRFSGETSDIKGRLDRIKNEFIERWTGYVSAYDTRYSDTLDTLRCLLAEIPNIFSGIEQSTSTPSAGVIAKCQQLAHGLDDDIERYIRNHKLAQDIVVACDDLADRNAIVQLSGILTNMSVAGKKTMILAVALTDNLLTLTAKPSIGGRNG